MDQDRDTNGVLIRRLEAALVLDAGRGSSDYDLHTDVKAKLPEGRVLRPAAVLCPIQSWNGAPHVILTRRASHLKHHPGQIAFPGGKIDVLDVDAKQAALREADEEIGLQPRDVKLLGSLAPHETVTGYRVSPFVGLVPDGFQANFDPGEVEEVFRVPLDFLMNPANFRIEGRLWRGAKRCYFVIPYGPYYIWGATARILKVMAERVHATHL